MELEFADHLHLGLHGELVEVGVALLGSNHKGYAGNHIRRAQGGAVRGGLQVTHRGV